MLRFNLLVISICAILYIPFLIIFFKRNYSIEKHIFCLTFYVYFCLIIKYTFFPIPVDISMFREIFKGKGLGTNIIPFKNIYGILKMAYYGNIALALRQIGGNLILFAPLGYLLPLIFKNKLNTFIKISITALIFSASIEIIQFTANCFMGFPYRAADIDDIILNTIGAVLGYLLFKLTKPIIRKLLPSFINSEIKSSI